MRQHFVRRKEICADHVHPLPIHGIYGRQEDGARSVVLSGKSEFQDEDQGDTLYVQISKLGVVVTLNPSMLACILDPAGGLLA